MSASKIIMWIIQPVLNVIVFHVLEVISHKNGSVSSEGDTVCTVLNPLIYGIIGFLAALVLILLILLIKLLSARLGISTHETRELTPLGPNDALNVCPPSVNGADDSSSTSSESPEGSLAELSSSSQRYVSLQDRRKTSDYINISEGVSSAQVDIRNEKPQDIDYVNVNEPRNEIIIKGQKNCDDETASMSSDTSAESALNYSTVVFTKM